jgi:orotidine-5'-phosphate decarboxylase
MSVCKSPILVALDYPTKVGALSMADRLDPSRCRLKVGKELFTAEGPSIVEALQNKGFEIFLDLKYHDIPNTCAKSVGAAAELGVWMVNVHASGGRKMMEAARNELAKKSHQPLLIAVTVLTSMEQSDLAEIGLDITPMQHVLRLAALAESSGMDGVVCSAQEAPSLREQVEKEFKLVTPGIRPSFAVAGDQKRIVTPSEAMKIGSDYLVIGRPITQAENPIDALALIEKELESVSN